MSPGVKGKQTLR